MKDLNCQDNDKTMRLQTVMAHAGVASRRACEGIIADGHVTVNGIVVTEMGSKVSLKDVICVDGKQIFQEEKKRYILLNKPIGYVCSLSDEKNRPVASDLLKKSFSERLYNVGRLDMYSSGLILFTNDGQFASVVSHPSAELEKEYLVETSLPFPFDLPEKFMKGIRIDNVFYKCRKAERISSRKIKIVLIEGKNREIRRVFESFDVHIKSLTRIRIGFLSLSDENGNSIESGKYRELSEQEVNKLLMLCKRK